MVRSLHITRRLGPTLAILAFVGACSRSETMPAPSPIQAPLAAVRPATWVPSWPSHSRAARAYAAVSPTPWSAHASALHSRFLLFDNGDVALQYSSASRPFFEYLGTYRENAGTVTFDWEGWSVAGAWGATGTITEQELAVKFNIIMSLSDFEDATYVRSAP
jgi:hypothetical protein